MKMGTLLNCTLLVVKIGLFRPLLKSWATFFVDTSGNAGARCLRRTQLFLSFLLKGCSYQKQPFLGQLNRLKDAPCKPMHFGVQTNKKWKVVE